MTNKDKQDVISVCNILADKMSDSGKVAVQQIIGAVEDMVENEPCEDYISLNKLDDIITKAIDESENQTECQTLRWVLDVMSELPSVTPQTVTDFADKCKECGKILNDKLKTRWIPVSEKPQEGRYLCTYEHWYGKCIDFGSFDGEVWYVKPIAYMPLPEPYKAESEVEE